MVEDIEFYVDEALASGGPVVELAVGTGPDRRPDRAGGRPGDRRRPVGAGCSTSRARSPRSTASATLVDLRVGDLREPPVDERVPLVICPFRSLLHMPTSARSCGRCGPPASCSSPAAGSSSTCSRRAREDIEETHGLWLEREPGIFERADWDEATGR